jgi:hypothetical protein
MTPQLGLYALLAVIMILLLAGYHSALTRAAFSTADRSKMLRMFGIGLTVWILYLILLSETGVLTVMSLPPRLPLLAVLPAIGIGIYLLTRPKFRFVREHLPQSFPVYFQSFRIVVELLLFGLFSQGIIPKEATFEGYNYEVAVGITALLAGYFGCTKKILPKQVLIAWNIWGLCMLSVIAGIFVLSLVNPALFGYPETPLKPEFGILPNFLPGGFFLPAAVCMHFLSLQQLFLKKENIVP